MPRRLPIRPALACLMLFVLTTAPATAQKSEIGFLRVGGDIAPDGRAVTLSWSPPEEQPPGNAVVSRRRLGEEGAETWRVIAPKLGRRLNFRDITTQPGIAYEYRVERQDIGNGATISAGYWATGVNVPATEWRGVALLVVDETVAGPLAARLDRFEMDLIGDGWEVRRLSSPRGIPDDAKANLVKARGVRAAIRAAHRADPLAVKAVVLVGHVPMAPAGRAAPDGHEPVAHVSDAFYADMNGQWADDGNGTLLHNTIAGGRIDLMVGRIDFANVATAFEDELDLLRSYFDRNHAWRHGLLGSPRGAYGQSGHLTGEIHALDNIVGPHAVEAGGHGDIGQARPWLVGIDFGFNRGGEYRSRFSTKAAFAINFGSHKQKIGLRRNAMNALLAQPWYPLAVGWGGRPTWRLHHMAMGYPMGYSHLRTLNNGLPQDPYPEAMDYVPTGRYVFRNPVWVNLLGDPTIRPFPLPPVQNLAATRTAAGVRIEWTLPDGPGVSGVRVFRGEATTGPYKAIDGWQTVTATDFLDAGAPAGSWYMVRTAGLQKVHAGSFHDLAQGRFTQEGAGAVAAPDIAFSVPPGETLVVLDQSQTPGGEILAPIRGVADGSLTRSGDIWTLEPRAGFQGDLELPYMASNGRDTATGTILVTVGGP